MVMALSKRDVELARKLYRAVILTAKYRAKKAVIANIRAQGLKVHNYSCRDLVLLAEAYMERNREQLIEAAKAEVYAWPEFARWRDVVSVRKDTGNRTLQIDTSVNHRTIEQ